MQNDWSLVIAIAALLVSVLSPTLTAIVNNSHARKMHELEFYQSHRVSAIESFIRSAGRCCGDGAMENFGEHGAHFGEIYMYIPETLWPMVDDINAALAEPDYKKAQSALLKFCKELSRAGLAPKFRPQ